MTEEDLRKTVLAMEGPLNRIDELNNLLVVMVDQCRSGLDNQSKLYSFLQRNLGDDLDKIQELWHDLWCELVQGDDKPPLKAVEE